MSLRTRLNLRRDWPLWVAILLSILALLYFLFTVSNPLNSYPFDGAVIYPFVLIVHATTIYLFCFSGVFLLIAGLWALVAIKQEDIPKMVTVSVVLAVIGLSTRSFSSSVIVLLLSMLVFTIGFSYRQSPKRAVTLILAVVAVIGWFFPSFVRIFQEIHHRDTIGFNGAVYQVGQIQDIDLDCEKYYFVVYQCDSLGFVCHPRFTSDQYGTCFGYPTNPLPTQVSLTVDPATDQLYLQLDDERSPIEP